MNIRTFQIVVPLLGVIFILWQFWKIYNFKSKWKALWPGKQIYQNNDVALKVIKGKVESDDAMVTYKVDGLSGATLTSRGVSNMIEYWFSESGYSSMLKELDYES